ncbi:hypothetical protein J6590_058089 [Homalodisca vitripennis]|nr:hypothetical protein J6590_058089 [Homalodisca vitripennis]
MATLHRVAPSVSPRPFNQGTGIGRLSAIVNEVKTRGDSSHLDKDVGTVTLELDLKISRKSLELFLQRILWENLAKDREGNTMQIIRFKVRSRVVGDRHNGRPLCRAQKQDLVPASLYGMAAIAAPYVHNYHSLLNVLLAPSQLRVRCSPKGSQLKPGLDFFKRITERRITKSERPAHLSAGIPSLG